MSFRELTLDMGGASLTATLDIRYELATEIQGLIQIRGRVLTRKLTLASKIRVLIHISAANVAAN